MIAVLTADLVHSTKLPKGVYKDTLALLSALLKAEQKRCGADSEIYRGDGFQVRYTNPLQALESTLAIKLGLHAAECAAKPILCTMALAFGEDDACDDKSTGKPGTAMGQAFIDSGRALEQTARAEMTLTFGQAVNSEELNLLTRFFNHQLNNLTKSQAQLLSQYIESGFAEHRALAQLTGTSRQNISNRLSSIGAFLIRDYVRLVNHHVTRIAGEE
ncbi:hypothetical protein [Halioxenophilus aromaticivorans]|uniref:Uncharacterized protein n=1 Tax=Halioxenophilus aromaticivorans TaxID=1306992 RepID=A0AAV3U4Z6_9ALTE